MQRIAFALFASSSVLALTQVAFAADMPVKAPVYKAPMVAPVFSWTGFYIGGHVGGAWSTSTWETDATLVPLFDPVSHDASSFIGGGQVGFRYQFAPNWVMGIEGRYSWTDLHNNELSQFLVNAGFPNRFRETHVKDIYAITGELGYAWDRWLVYAKGGWAGSRVDLSTRNANPGGASASVSGDATGFTVGAGVDYALWQNWNLGVEYAYYDLDMGNKPTTQSNGNPANFNNFETKIHSLVARLNYKFNWGAPAVVTKY